jgi:2-iminobutanoate/2-iminopropanoate deaminase
LQGVLRVKRQTFQVPGRRPSPILNPAVRVGDLIWTAGHTGSDPATGQSPDDFDAQVRNTLNNVKAAVEAAGSSLASVVKVNIYLTDISLRPAFNKIYLEYFPTDQPGRTCIGNAGFEGNTKVEVECVAVVE